ncbi:MAG TPA: HAMP domain-containing sensor histidine kinase [Streptosporangiaceae bacterium]|nr:HAMP domain-containing sensor histidine kinase [Streptosporangiaceae bacterium]
MTRARGPLIGGLGLRLALVFIAVALAAVAAVITLGSMTTTRDVHHLIRQQRLGLTRATAIAAGVAYGNAGWPRADLAPLTDLVAHTGAAVQVRNLAGQVIDASPGFASRHHGPQLSEPVRVRGRRVGMVAVRFDDSGLGAAIQRFQAHRWRARITAASAAALIALVAALLISRRITSSVDRLIRTARARSRGELGARAGDVTGFGEIRELAEAFDQMADASDEQDRVRRNLVADVAHELRTPIAVLQAGHEAMLDGVAQPAAEDLVSLRDEVLRLARMVDDLQRLASAEAAALQLTLVPGDLAAIAQTAADRLADSFDAAGITLRRELTEVEVRCDPTRMHEIATNLLTNALKFTPPGGTVLLQTGPQEPAREHALLRVSDTGIGIQPDDLPRVSDRFFRSQRTAGIAGSGIGLTIVAEVVRGHRGTMDIASEPDVGTQVTVVLPVA